MKPKSKRKTPKRIKESVTEHEYKKLMSAVRGDESLRPSTQQSYFYQKPNQNANSLQVMSL